MTIKPVSEQLLEQLTQKIDDSRQETLDICSQYKAELEAKISTQNQVLINMVADISHQIEVNQLNLRQYIQRRFFLIMSQFDPITQAIAEDTDVTSSAISLMESLAARLEETAGDPARVAQLAADIRANSARMAAAVVANTTAETPPTEPAPPVENPPVEPTPTEPQP